LHTILSSFLNLRLPIAANGGLVHLGNVPLFVIAILYGRRFGALAGEIGKRRKRQHCYT